jgi:hypothetical protein
MIGGDKFSGNPCDWTDVKTEIVSTIEGAGYSYITKMGAYLFNVAGSVSDHGHIEDCDLEKHFKKKMWLTQLCSIWSQVTKSTLDDKCEEYQKLTDDEKTEIRDWKVIEWFSGATLASSKRCAIIFSPRRKREDRSPRSYGNSS